MEVEMLAFAASSWVGTEPARSRDSAILKGVLAIPAMSRDETQS